MTVIAFERTRIAGAWSAAELNTLVGALAGAREWDTGITENGDAQLYLLGPRPDQACELCVSRIGGRYILEDGAGRLLFEHRSLPLVAMHARTALRITRWSLVARMVVVWCTIRDVVHDRIEPLLGESEELLAHLTPQLAAFV
ncbi:MAG: hypothetical protein JWR89_1679 [Tardiphaga sp.]|jgi:hypothetical protein|uniref:hypothetical protein n=1 Tax=Tardiphaga sp. TaxID=1926292 RepID=UPI0026398B0B|nr:hypothetical protein [Tardiphaga sp.]MDB5501777.1 hypothetical protein [Tardiphaga sp.]